MEKKLNIFQKIEASFDNGPDGFSARKLSAFTAVMVCVVATFKYADNKIFINVLMVWLTFGLLCLGIITAEQVLRFYKKEGDAPTEPASEPVKDEADKEDPTDPKL